MKRQQARTKDEQFLVCLYQETVKHQEEDPTFAPYEIGKMVGLQSRAVDAICVLLFRTNFIKKSEENKIYITPHGIKLVLTIIES